MSGFQIMQKVTGWKVYTFVSLNVLYKILLIWVNLSTKVQYMPVHMNIVNITKDSPPAYVGPNLQIWKDLQRNVALGYMPVVICNERITKPN